MGQTDGLTRDRYMNSALRIMRAVAKRQKRVVPQNCGFERKEQP